MAKFVSDMVAKVVFDPDAKMLKVELPLLIAQKGNVSPVYVKESAWQKRIWLLIPAATGIPVIVAVPVDEPLLVRVIINVMNIIRPILV